MPIDKKSAVFVPRWPSGLREIRVANRIAGNELQVTSYNPFRAVRPDPASRSKVMREFAASGNLEMMGYVRCRQTVFLDIGNPGVVLANSPRYSDASMM